MTLTTKVRGRGQTDKFTILTELNLELSLLTGLKERRGPKLDSDPHKFHQVFFNVFPIRVAQFLKLTKQIPQMEHFNMF